MGDIDDAQEHPAMFTALPTLIPHLDDQRRATLLRRAERYRCTRPARRRERRR